MYSAEYVSFLTDLLYVSVLPCLNFHRSSVLYVFQCCLWLLYLQIYSMYILVLTLPLCLCSYATSASLRAAVEYVIALPIPIYRSALYYNAASTYGQVYLTCFSTDYTYCLINCMFQ
jgi:hypothetical protein